jgi:hypothetical protein
VSKTLANLNVLEKRVSGFCCVGFSQSSSQSVTGLKPKKTMIGDIRNVYD